ncbi:LysR family transcriptional regulator [Crenobacter sp. SG2303]|uniref:LysR family transcriptional regulator n=1 Tax=Crenobacter oryzisoli TaxID=3056844 RepID=A0ABT7XTI0_9NEIS|nr:LysR family transcriptional regulator [Crenobacter sp. SG2303]MDN0077035.1 LysR family transcriptional regulator [Crenobacter sp. SG2303]
MELNEIDLNLLNVFNELLKCGSVSATARALGVSQPGVSNALNRLRTLLGDELFLRTSRGMEPTPYAEMLAEPIAFALSTIHSTINQRATFDAATSQRNFTVAMTDIGEIYFLPVLIKLLAEIAPQVTLSTVRNNAVNLRDEMEAGRVDLAIGLLPDLKTGFFQRRLFDQKYVCLFRKEHPFEQQGITQDTFTEADHVVIVSAGTGHGQVDELLEQAGVHRKVKLRVPHFVAVGHILQASDMIAVVPERFAERTLAPFDLVYVPCPVKLPAISINILWHAKNHREPGNQWLRTLISDAFSDNKVPGNDPI